MEPPEIVFACPTCRRSLEGVAPGRLRCRGDGVELVLARGIWRRSDLPPDAGAEKFLADYRRLRSDEGWGSDDPGYYRELPFRDSTGRHAEVWRIRAESYRQLLERVVAGGRRLRIADLGAGNCWLSRRLAQAGHSVAAIDLSDDASDGLGAADKYSEITGFVRIQSGFDEVPLADGELDLAIFNGSFHYSSDGHRTLAEAWRVLRPGGRVVIMDSPVYRRAASGERMVEERRQAWQERYEPGFGEAAGEGFLTRRRLHELGAAAGWSWEIRPLPLGWRWHVAPLAALVLGRREPARFPLIIGRQRSRPSR